MKEKLFSKVIQEFSEQTKIEAHYQPLTACNFNRKGDFFFTTSFDHTCKVWSADSGKLVQKLKGHRKAVYSAAFSSQQAYVSADAAI